MTNEWKTLTRDAQQAYRSCRFNDAIKMNILALKLSSRAFEHNFKSKPEKAIASVIISYLNIIDGYVAENELAIAKNFFEDLYYFLERSSSRVIKNDEQSIAVLNGLRKTHTEWALFKQNNPDLLMMPSYLLDTKLLMVMSHISVNGDTPGDFALAAVYTFPSKPKTLLL